MPRVGNDIVDLGLPENQGRGRDSRLLDRICLPEERDAIARCDSPDTRLWTLWAAKEAAYKAVSRDDPAVCSVPRRYAVMLYGGVQDGSAAGADGAGGEGPVGLQTGTVQTPRGELAVGIALSGRWVHALAADSAEALARLIVGIERLDDAFGHRDPSRTVREGLFRCLAERWGCPVEAIEIRKDPWGPGVPRLFLSGREKPVTVSLSHDGRYTAFALGPPS